jgi:1-deoxy-D-xylulose-5-phosphate reductoisomerase
MRTVTVLGSTGSIGTQTLDVAERRGWRVERLAAGRNAARLVEQARRHDVREVVCHPDVHADVRAALGAEVDVHAGDGALEALAAAPADTVVAAIPGMAGVPAVLAAVRAGRHVALATKEAMVVAGPLVHAAARASGGRVTPVDSEHAGVAQLLLGERREAIDTILLTASGGPFRDGPADLSTVTPEAALAHPTWAMGPRVTIDSATLFNKGLEVLEAHALFGFDLDAIEVVVHRQSWVHALVRFRDGSLKAQVGPHDMRLPILWGVEENERPTLGLDPFPLEGTWTFEPPDRARFPALDLAYEAGRRGGVAPAVLNAADEVAVAAFLDGALAFDAIPRVLAHALDAVPPADATWEALRAADADARRGARDAIASGAVR